MVTEIEGATIRAIERPDAALLRYYLLSSLAAGPFFPFLALPLYFRYHTMRYRFTDEGISMRWGILFRREIIIQYARIQDIHLRSNVVERWMGLGRVLIQTASGNAGAEMTLEGITIFEEVRDYLYHRMRGVKDDAPSSRSASRPPALPGTAGVGATGGASGAVDGAAGDELATVLREVATELRALRETLANGNGTGRTES